MAITFGGTEVGFKVLPRDSLEGYYYKGRACQDLLDKHGCSLLGPNKLGFAEQMSGP